MKKKKHFDCVVMKWEIQKQIAEEFAGIPDKEAQKIQRERIARNPHLGAFLKKVRSLQKAPLKEPLAG